MCSKLARGADEMALQMLGPGVELHETCACNVARRGTEPLMGETCRRALGAKPWQ